MRLLSFKVNFQSGIFVTVFTANNLSSTLASHLLRMAVDVYKIESKFKLNAGREALFPEAFEDKTRFPCFKTIEPTKLVVCSPAQQGVRNNHSFALKPGVRKLVFNAGPS